MYFNGTYTKFNEGDTVLLQLSEENGFPVKVISIGILGNKLSGHLFLYRVRDDLGNNYDVKEDVLFPLK